MNLYLIEINVTFLPYNIGTYIIINYFDIIEYKINVYSITNGVGTYVL